MSANELNWSLYYAAQNGDESSIVNLLKKGANVNFCEPTQKLTPLHVALFNGDRRICKILIDHGAELEAKNHQGETPLLRACVSMNIEIVKFLLDSGANVNCQGDFRNTPLHLAVCAKNIDLVKLLLEKGASIFTANNADHLPIHCACQSGNKKIVELLLEKNGDKQINILTRSGENSLHFATKSGNCEIVKMLLELGANQISQNLNGEFPLHIAAASGNYEMLKLLVRHGAKIDCSTKIDETPLDYALKHKQLKMALFLMLNCQKVNFEKVENFRPLHMAVAKRNKIALEFFLACGADVNLVDFDNKTALDICFQKNYIPEMKILLSHITQLEFTNSYVSEKNLKRINTIKERTNFEDELDEELKNFLKNCEQKLCTLKNLNILENYKVTLYDLLTKPMEKIVIYLRDDQIRKEIEKLDFYKYNFEGNECDYPIYANYVAVRVLLALTKAGMFTECEPVMHSIAPVELPIPCIREILNYLNKKDMSALLTTCEVEECTSDQVFDVSRKIGALLEWPCWMINSFRYM